MSWRDIFNLTPSRSPITLWSFKWRPGSKTSPPLLQIGGILVFIGSVLILLMIQDAYKAHRLAVEGRLATGTVTQKVINRATDNSDSHTSYKINYSFTSADGRKIDGSDTVDPDVWDQLKEGDPVQIEYAAGQPQMNQIGPSAGISILMAVMLGTGAILWVVGAVPAVKGLFSLSSALASRSARRLPTASSDSDASDQGSDDFRKPIDPVAVFGPVLAAVGAIFLLVGFANLSQERAFRSQGKIATAIILTKSSHEKYDHQSQTYETEYHVTYRFVTAEGRAVRGSREVDHVLWKSMRERDPIQIVYLASDPVHNRLASEHPGALLWIVTIIGGLLSLAGIVLTGDRFFAVVSHRHEGRQRKEFGRQSE